MKFVSFVFSILLILWSLFIVMLKHQHLGLNTESEGLDFLLWAIYGSIHLVCVMSILFSWISRRAVSAQLLFYLYLSSLIMMVVFIWLFLVMDMLNMDGDGFFTVLWESLVMIIFYTLPLIIPQSLLFYVWCIKPIKNRSSSCVNGKETQAK